MLGSTKIATPNTITHEDLAQIKQGWKDASTPVLEVLSRVGNTKYGDRHLTADVVSHAIANAEFPVKLQGLFKKGFLIQK